VLNAQPVTDFLEGPPFTRLGALAMASRTVQLARERAWQVREIQGWLWTAARPVTCALRPTWSTWRDSSPALRTRPQPDPPRAVPFSENFILRAPEEDGRGGCMKQS